MTIKNFFAFALLAAATFVISSDCNAQDREGRKGPPGEYDGQGGGERGGRGGPGGERGGQRGPRSPEDMLARFPIIKALDADGNGEISTAEMESASTALATLDANSDGVLDTSELMPARGGRGEGGPRGPRGEGGGGGPRGDRSEGGPRGEGGGRGGDSEAFVNRMLENDTDGDGKVSLEEAPERMQNFFERLDGDSDGFLTREEITEASNRFNGGRGGGGGEGQRPRRPAAE